MKADSMFGDFHREQEFHDAWQAVQIERDVEYGLFTFGDSELPYYLVTGPEKSGDLVSVREGMVTIARARILTPDSVHPEFRDFFAEHEDESLIQFVLARTAAFSNMKFVNRTGPESLVTDTPEEAVDRLNRRLDAEEEDRVAVLSAPYRLAGLAVFRYATTRIVRSAPDNLQDLRDRGLLP